MQLTTAERTIATDPGHEVELVVDVVNTSNLIDGVSASLVGLPDASVTVEPKLLPLFPEASGQIRLRVHVPSTTAAGTHPVSVALESHAGTGTHHVGFELAVAARPDIELRADPKLVRARRSGQFVLEVENTGNTALDVRLGAEYDDRRTTVTFVPDTFISEPGSSIPVLVRVRGPRMFTGSDVDRRVTIDLRAHRLHVIPAMLETEPEQELRASTTILLRQRPLIGRGVLTALILIGIVALWALAFLLGLTQVFASDPLTKTVPTSFPTSVVRADSDSAEGSPGATVPGSAPPGALPKTGLVPAGVGGSVTGVVTARSDAAPIGRITVQAYRDGRNGPVLVSSAASQTDGSYNVSGLFPTQYRLKFSAKGYRTVWYPAAGGRAGAARVGVNPQAASSGTNVVITGRPATIEGTVDPGDALTPPITTVTARMVGTTTSTSVSDRPAAETVSDPTGAYSLTGLPAPGTYELSFTAPGYQVTKVLTKVSGGETRLQPSIVPGAGHGSIAGTVLSNGQGLGNVTVSTTVAGESVLVKTPTVGATGAFNLGNLPTPGTYVVQFTAPDHGTTTRIFDLEAGGNESGVRIDLASGTGSVTGRLTSADGTGLGGATVTVGGTNVRAEDMAANPSTTTLTAGEVGAFTLAGLAVPGDYTLTFTLAGYTPETVPVSLDATGAVTGLKVVLGSQLGTVSGRVLGPGGTPYVGATVTVTNGISTWTTTSTSPGGALPAGGYQVTGLPPGTFAITANASGLRQQTAMVTVRPGIESIQKLQLGTP